MLPLSATGRSIWGISVDAYAKVSQAKLYVAKTPITAADLMDDTVENPTQRHTHSFENRLPLFLRSNSCNVRAQSGIVLETCLGQTILDSEP